MSPSPLSLAATVTYHRIILISRGKTAGRSWPSWRTLLLCLVYTRFAEFSTASGKKEPVTPTSGGVTGVGCGLSRPSEPPSPLAGYRRVASAGGGRFPGSGGRTTRRDASSARTIPFDLAHSWNFALPDDPGDAVRRDARASSQRWTRLATISPPGVHPRFRRVRAPSEER